MTHIRDLEIDQFAIYTNDNCYIYEIEEFYNMPRIDGEIKAIQFEDQVALVSFTEYELQEIMVWADENEVCYTDLPRLLDFLNIKDDTTLLYDVYLYHYIQDFLSEFELTTDELDDNYMTTNLRDSNLIAIIYREYNHVVADADYRQINNLVQEVEIMSQNQISRDELNMVKGSYKNTLDLEKFFKSCCILSKSEINAMYLEDYALTPSFEDIIKFFDLESDELFHLVLSRADNFCVYELADGRYLVHFPDEYHGETPFSDNLSFAYVGAYQ